MTSLQNPNFQTRFVHLRDATDFKDWSHEETQALWQIINPKLDDLNNQGLESIGAGVFAINGTLQFGLFLNSSEAAAQALAELLKNQQAKVIDVTSTGTLLNAADASHEGTIAPEAGRQKS